MNTMHGFPTPRPGLHFDGLGFVAFDIFDVSMPGCTPWESDIRTWEEAERHRDSARRRIGFRHIITGWFIRICGRCDYRGKFTHLDWSAVVCLGCREEVELGDWVKPDGRQIFGKGTSTDDAQ